MKKFLLLLIFTLLPLPAIAFCFQEAGQRYAVSPWLLWAIAKAESNLDPTAINHNSNETVDIGLMQINSILTDQLGKTWKDLGDPCTNVLAGAWILKKCIQDYGYSWQAVGCYYSRTPALGNAYASRIAAILEQSGAGQ